jgi:hypothetical protein
MRNWKSVKKITPKQLAALEAAMREGLSVPATVERMNAAEPTPPDHPQHITQAKLRWILQRNGLRVDIRFVWIDS